jgi:hypothetical protein
VLCGITVKNFAICGMQNSKSLSIFDNQLKQIKEVKLKNMPKKLQLLQDQENLMCGEWYGNIEIVSTSTWEVVGSLCISSAQTILDIAKLPAPNQYAISLANEGGLQTIEIKKTQKGFELFELKNYLKGESVWCIHLLPNECLLVGGFNCSDMKVLDLNSGKVIKTIPNPSKDEWYNSFQSF